jgi:hypothetical protein
MQKFAQMGAESSAWVPNQPSNTLTLTRQDAGCREEVTIDGETEACRIAVHPTEYGTAASTQLSLSTQSQ